MAQHVGSFADDTEESLLGIEHKKFMSRDEEDPTGDKKSIARLTRAENRWQQSGSIMLARGSIAGALCQVLRLKTEVLCVIDHEAEVASLTSEIQLLPPPDADSQFSLFAALDALESGSLKDQQNEVCMVMRIVLVNETAEASLALFLCDGHH